MRSVIIDMLELELEFFCVKNLLVILESEFGCMCQALSVSIWELSAE